MQLWCQSDFDHIKHVTGYKFGHYFKTSSVAGTSGLAIFAKWSPETIHFEPYTVNGSPFKPHHGDWFAGKGVAYVRIDLMDLRLHLFCTHVSLSCLKRLSKSCVTHVCLLWHSTFKT
jgi:sphingomyelin phosphodiesterase 2